MANLHKIIAANRVKLTEAEKWDRSKYSHKPTGERYRANRELHKNFSEKVRNSHPNHALLHSSFESVKNGVIHRIELHNPNNSHVTKITVLKHHHDAPYRPDYSEAELKSHNMRSPIRNTKNKEITGRLFHTTHAEDYHGHAYEKAAAAHKHF